MSNYAVVELSWTPSASIDLAQQIVWLEKYDSTMNSWLVQSGLPPTHPPTVNSLQIDCDEKSKYRFNVQAVDTAGLSSETVVHEFMIGDLTNPEATTELKHAIVEVKHR